VPALPETRECTIRRADPPGSDRTRYLSEPGFATPYGPETLRFHARNPPVSDGEGGEWPARAGRGRVGVTMVSEPDTAMPPSPLKAALRTLRDALPIPGPGAIEVQRADLAIPHLPPDLDGLTILQVSDTHVTARNPATRDLHNRLLTLLESPDPSWPAIDLAVLSGDYMNVDGDEHVATECLRDLVHTSAKLTRRGCFGVFGNHDHAELKDLVRARSERDRWPVTWMHSETLTIDGLPLDVIGSDWPEAFDAASTKRPERLSDGAPLRLALGHTPDSIGDAHRAGAHLLLAGHTHGGQIRLNTARGVLAGFTASTIVPRRAPSGIYRFRHDSTPHNRETTLAVTRGVGFQLMPVRINCPPQIVLYTLRAAEPDRSEETPMPPEPAGPDGRLEVVRVW